MNAARNAVDIAMKDIREKFLDMIADCDVRTIVYCAKEKKFSGQMVDLSSFTIRGPLASLHLFIEALGIQPRHEQSLNEALRAAIKEKKDRALT
jgi:hypothetical protein